MTAALDHPGRLGDLAPIGLEELTAAAGLQTRIDRKYILPVGEVGALLARIGPEVRVLQIEAQRSFRYESVYFDTPELTSYRMAAYRRRRRFKIRTRTYLESSVCWLEVKTRGARGNTVKHRLPYDTGDCASLDGGLDFIDDVLTGHRAGVRADAAFAPVLVTGYRRSTLFLPASASRATIDTELSWHDPDHRHLRLPGLAVVETKSGSGASALDRLLWTDGYRPIRVSKYATGLAALRQELPAAPWWRTLRRHFHPPMPDRRKCGA